ncbi:hypothetical protein [Tunicatimonas pelagia]|nr:hypothetical protein [Tunicatimonas pelagia]WKN43993.1 hypothetical protein P0M28_03275 [Tunicatimonas pelagia]
MKTYKPKDIYRWGISRFVKEVTSKKSLSISDLEFTEEKNLRMKFSVKDF